MLEISRAAGIVDSLVEALETMAFISPVPGDRGAVAPPHPRHITLEFTCPQPGAVRFMADQSFGALLASNLIGVDPEAPEAQACADDALMELMNVTCGAAIRQFGNADDQRLHMSLPRLSPVSSASEWAEFLARESVIVLNAEGQTIAFEATGLEAK